MKNFLRSGFILVFLSSNFFSQTPECGYDALLELYTKQTSRSYEQDLRRMNESIKEYIAYNFPGGALPKGSAPNSYVIPVVFHIVHPSGQAYGTGANIPYARILSQMNALNAAFGKGYPAYNGQTHPTYAQNTTIQFCLAKTAMPSTVSFYNGSAGVENGVMRYADNTATAHLMNPTSVAGLLALTHPSPAHFPYNKYLNIWLVTSISTSGPGNVMAYAPTPIMSNFPLDGVVSRADIIGDNSTGNNFPLGFGLQQGKVLAHEIGHYLNLYHIFQGGCSGMNASGATTDACDLNGDYICDIEPANTQNYNCNSPIPNTCNANYSSGTTTMDMIENYMSYADDDCMSTFTSGQSQRMWATLNSLRSNLWQTANLSATGIIGTGSCISPYLITSINKSTSNICAGVSFTLSNPTAGNSASTRLWSMPGGVPATASTATVTVSYPTAGSYWCKLTLTNGTLTAKDSMLIHVTNCNLDSSKLDRSHWYFSDYSEIKFGNTGASVGTSAMAFSTIQKGWEATVSMSDKNGRLLFYTNSIDLWDSKHQKKNTSSPIFDCTAQGGSSTPGVISIPWPKDSSKYIIISSPHSGMGYDSIYYVVYDTALHTVTKRRSFKHSMLPPKYAEPLTVVPHCNGRDYWILTTPFYNIANNNRIYAILLTPAGPANIDTVAISYNITNQPCGAFKSNSKGTRLIRANWGSFPHAYFYKFDKASGIVSNEVSSNYAGNSVSYGAIFSPNDSIAYVLSTGNSVPAGIFKTNLQTMVTQPVSSPNLKGSLMEAGPDNNIYVSQSDWNAMSMGRLINTNSYSGVTYVPNVLTFVNPANPFGGLCNFMDAKKPAEISIDFTHQMVNCNTVKFMVDSCWQMYRAKWSFGDATNGSGLTVTHNYALSGAFSVTLQLSVGNYNLPPVVKVIQILPQNNVAVSGPPSICLGSTFLNNYGVAVISGATYTWSVVNGTIAGFPNQSNVNVAAGAVGTVTVSVVVSHGGCNTSGTRTIQVNNAPVVSFVAPATSMCAKKPYSLTATPPGGVFSGSGVTGSVLTAPSAGTYVVYYTVSNSSSCTTSASLSLNVSGCVNIESLAGNDPSISAHPNPTQGKISVLTDVFIPNGIINIYNIAGQLIRSVELNYSGDIDITLQPPGIYYLRVQDGSELKASFKIIKE